MNRQQQIINSVLWASAIIASAIVGAPNMLTIILLPAMAIMSLVLSEQNQKKMKCIQK